MSPDVLVTFLVTETMSDTLNLKEERFTLANSFRDFSPWLAAARQKQDKRGAQWRKNCSFNGSQEAEAQGKSWGRRYTLPDHIPSDLPLLIRSPLDSTVSY